MTTGEKTPVTTLVADDDQMMLFVYRALLETEGYKVTTVDNGLEALEALRSGGYTLAILDQFMPGYTGSEIAQQLALEQSDTRIVVLSGDADAEEDIAGLPNVRFVIKGTDPDQFLNMLSDWMES